MYRNPKTVQSWNKLRLIWHFEVYYLFLKSRIRKRFTSQKSIFPINVKWGSELPNDKFLQIGLFVCKCSMFRVLQYDKCTLPVTFEWGMRHTNSLGLKSGLRLSTLPSTALLSGWLCHWNLIQLYSIQNFQDFMVLKVWKIKCKMCSGSCLPDFQLYKNGFFWFFDLFKMMFDFTLFFSV
jgi:hypothetical protein